MITVNVRPGGPGTLTIGILYHFLVLESIPQVTHEHLTSSRQKSGCCVKARWNGFLCAPCGREEKAFSHRGHREHRDNLVIPACYRFRPKFIAVAKSSDRMAGWKACPT